MVLQKKIKVSYNEQSKAVTTDAVVEYSGETNEVPNNEDVVKEVQELFDHAQRYSIRKTMEKNR